MTELNPKVVRILKSLSSNGSVESNLASRLLKGRTMTSTSKTEDTGLAMVSPILRELGIDIPENKPQLVLDSVTTALVLLHQKLQDMQTLAALDDTDLNLNPEDPAVQSQQDRFAEEFTKDLRALKAHVIVSKYTYEHAWSPLTPEYRFIQARTLLDLTDELGFEPQPLWTHILTNNGNMK